MTPEYPYTAKNISFQNCPLCNSVKFQNKVQGPDKRQYYLCGNCSLIYVDRKYPPEKNREKQRYLKHENSLQNKGYVEFLNNAVNPAMQFLKPGMKGLDYGCGPYPTLSALLEKRRILCDNYDPIFFPDIAVSKKYDFIFATECFEHFFCPGAEISKLLTLLKSGSLLIVMTDLWENAGKFNGWAYAKDFTHTAFYSNKTFLWISEYFRLEKLYDDGKRVFVFRISKKTVKE